MPHLAQVLLRYQAGLEQFCARPEFRITLYSGSIELAAADQGIDHVLRTALAQRENQFAVTTHTVANQPRQVLEKVRAIFPAPFVRTVADIFYSDNIVQAEKE